MYVTNSSRGDGIPNKKAYKVSQSVPLLSNFVRWIVALVKFTVISMILELWVYVPAYLWDHDSRRACSRTGAKSKFADSANCRAMGTGPAPKEDTYHTQLTHGRKGAGEVTEKPRDRSMVMCVMKAPIPPDFP